MKNQLLRIENLSYPELDALDRSKTLFILSISPLEEHGPHMPLGVDLFISKYMSEQLQERILAKHPEFTIVLFPPLFLGVGAIPWLGSFNSKQRVIRSVIEDWAAVLGKYGFKYFLLSNGHGGPRHVVALEEAARSASKKHNMTVVSLSGRIAYEFLTGKYLKEIETELGRPFTVIEKRKFFKDSHAGWWETSVMLMLFPDLVNKNFAQLPDFTISWRDRLFKKKKDADQGYRGFPAMASTDFASATVKVLLDKSMELIGDMLYGHDLGNRLHSPLYNIWFLRTNFFRYGVTFTIFLFLCVLYFITDM
ncbi:MAG: creatininase family protein [Calditrichaeota bacterium]|nr:MAG: creatininase family protein [Calditrichota bacterium]